MEIYNPEDDFVTHEPLKAMDLHESAKQKNFLAFSFDPLESSPDYENKSAYQLFEAFRYKILSYLPKTTQISLVSVERKFLNQPNPAENSANEPVYLLNSSEIKSSLATELLQPNVFEENVSFFKYVANFLEELLLKPQEFLYTSQACKPNKRVSRNIAKIQKIKDYYYRVTLVILSQKTHDKIELCQFFEENFQIKLLKSNTIDYLNENIAFQYYKEIKIANFRYGLLEKRLNCFNFLWDLNNLDDLFQQDVRKKALLARISQEKHEKTLDLALVFLIHYKENAEKQIIPRNFLLKIEFSVTEVSIEKRKDSLFFYFPLRRRFPLCFYKELDENFYVSPLKSEDFIRCPNFLVDSAALDPLLLSYLKEKAAFSIEISRDNTYSEDFLSLCQHLKSKGFIKEYTSEEKTVENQFLQGNYENKITMRQLNQYKSLSFSLKWMLLVLDSLHKLKLFSLTLHELTIFHEIPQEQLLFLLRSLAKDPNVQEISPEDFPQLLKKMHEKLVILSDFSLKSMMNTKKVLITPTHLVFCEEEPGLLINELEVYRKENKKFKDFLIASFVDEDFNGISSNPLICWTIFREKMQRPLNLLGKEFEFVGFSAKMLRKHAFLLVYNGKMLKRRIYQGLLGALEQRVDRIEENPLAPAHYRNLPYYCYRMNNCLAQGVKLMDLLTKNCLPLRLELADSQVNEGYISKDLLKVISQYFNEPSIAYLRVNFFGKTMGLLLNEGLGPRTLRVKKSIYEQVFKEVFFCEEFIAKSAGKRVLDLEEVTGFKGIFLEKEGSLDVGKIIVMDFAKKKRGFLSYYSINMFSHLEENNKLDFESSEDFPNFLLKYQKKLYSQLLIKNTSEVFIDKNLVKTLNKTDLSTRLSPEDYQDYQKCDFYRLFEQIKKNPAVFQHDVFFSLLKDTYISSFLQEYRRKASFSPFKHHYFLPIVPDPTNQIEPQEAFLQVNGPEEKDFVILQGDLLIYRDFAIIHQEFRLLQAKDFASLRNYANVLVVNEKTYQNLVNLSPCPYNLEDKFHVVNDNRMKLGGVDHSLKIDEDFLKDLEQFYRIATKKFNENNKEKSNENENEENIDDESLKSLPPCVLQGDVCAFFLERLAKNKEKTYKQQHLSFVIGFLEKIIGKNVARKDIESLKNIWFLPYLQELFACYCGLFETNIPKINNIIYNFFEHKVKQRQIIEECYRIEGLLYTETLGSIEKFDKGTVAIKGNYEEKQSMRYEFAQTHYDEDFYCILQDEDLVESLLKVFIFVVFLGGNYLVLITYLTIFSCKMVNFTFFL